MAWQKGQSGNPRGRLTEKVFADAIRLAVSEDDAVTGKRKLRAIAEKLVEEALKGESWAIQQVADRLDGKPAQALELSGETTHNYVARMPAPVKGMDEWQTRYSPNPIAPMTKQ